LGKPMGTQDIQQLVKSLASVTGNSECLDVLIFGAGLGGMAMLKSLSHFKGVSIHAIVDAKPDAPAFKLAKTMNITTSIDCESMLDSFEGDIVIDVTGDPNLYKKLLILTRPHHIELISAKSAKLLYDLANKELENESGLQIQNTKLDFLNSMLELTSQLENRPPVADVICKSLEHLHEHFTAKKGLALIAKSDEYHEIVGCTGLRQVSHQPCICKNIQQAFRDCSGEASVSFLAGSIELNSPEISSAYNFFLPVRQKNKVVAALLLDLPDTLTVEQKAMLSIASMHLDLTITTLASYRDLENMAIHDGLTGIFNRRYFDQKLSKEVSRIRRGQHEALTCAFIDVDDFKDVNDSYGHSIGDKVLRGIGGSISDAIRDYDICARYGGDEFVVLMPTNITEGDAHLEKIALRILKKIADIKISEAPSLNVSVSIGIAMQSAKMLNAQELLERADHAVYRAKKANKSCFRIHSDKCCLVDDEIDKGNSRAQLIATNSL